MTTRAIERTALSLAVLLVCAALSAAGADPTAVDPDRVERARQAFERYVALERDYRPELAEFYVSSARVEQVVRDRAGISRVVTIPAVAHRAALRATMAARRFAGDRGSYSAVSYSGEGDRVRVDAWRVSDATRHGSDISLVFGPDGQGQWRVWEERSAVR